jgi:hypothetical protein
MAIPAKTGGSGSRLGRSETVSIRLDPRLNYLCELAARSQRRTKSSFIEATIDEKIHSMPITNWRDHPAPMTIGERADFLWHVRESQRVASLGLAAPHLMTFEEQQIWACVGETGYFWKGRLENNVWTWRCEERSLIRERVDECWETIVAVANGEMDRAALPSVEGEGVARARFQLDDEIPF